MADAAQADHLVSMPQLAANGHRAEVIANSRFVALSQDALDVLAGQGDEVDGHFDGRYIWVGGTEYAVGRA